MLEKNLLIVIGGPTASGKTSLAIQLAQHFDTEIISADSRQFYKEMNIGTAKPSQEELAQAKHHFIGHLSISDYYSAGRFEIEAIAKISELFKSKEVVIAVGGSGLFLTAITEGLDDFPEISPEVREALNTDLEKNGIGSLQDKLKELDPDYYEKIDIQNPRRISRALEVINSTGKTMTSFLKRKQKSRPFDCLFLQPSWPREKLYERIDRRVELMFNEGLVDEVSALLAHKDLSSLKTVGYQEVFDHLEGKISLTEAKTSIQQNSHRYAKRQLTWTRQRGQWILLNQPFHTSALNVINILESGWNWKVTTLVSTQLKLQPEVKFLSLKIWQDEKSAEVLLMRTPKMAQAYFVSDTSIPKDCQLLVLHQLRLRVEKLPLNIWTKEALPLSIFAIQEKLNSKSSFPFLEWKEQPAQLPMYRIG